MDNVLELVELLAPQPGERILEVGCGLGRLAALLDQHGAEVTAIDPDPIPLDQARLAAPRARFVSAGLLDFSGAEPFDAIVSVAALHWIQPPDAAAFKLFDLLRPAGRLVAEWGGVPLSLAPSCRIPTVASLAATLERAGFDVRLVTAHDGDPGRARRLRAYALRPLQETP
jgi:trans-aconitate methyltransferase